jgi:hypothetical protein
VRQPQPSVDDFSARAGRCNTTRLHIVSRPKTIRSPCTPRLVAVPVPMPSPQNSHPISSQVGPGAQSCGCGSDVTGLAKCGWLVEVRLRPEREHDPRFFAVGTLEVGDAEEVVLRYPGIVREDKRTAQRPLSEGDRLPQTESGWREAIYSVLMTTASRHPRADFRLPRALYFDAFSSREPVPTSLENALVNDDHCGLLARGDPASRRYARLARRWECLPRSLPHSH